MEALYFFMVGIFISYIGFISLKYGILPSVSQSWYELPTKFKFLFTLFCWGFAIPAMICGGTALMFLAGAGIAFVGAAAQFKIKSEGIVHSAGAVLGILFSQLSIGLDFNMLYVNIAFVSSSLLIILLTWLKLLKNRTWWIEMSAFISICYVLGELIFGR